MWVHLSLTLSHFSQRVGKKEMKAGRVQQWHEARIQTIWHRKFRLPLFPMSLSFGWSSLWGQVDTALILSDLNGRPPLARLIPSWVGLCGSTGKALSVCLEGLVHRLRIPPVSLTLCHMAHQAKFSLDDICLVTPVARLLIYSLLSWVKGRLVGWRIFFCSS